MRTIILGKTGVPASVISLGAWSYGGPNQSGTMAVGWSGQQDDDSIKALLRCYEIGINHWDTADVYGNGKSELIIGSLWDKVPRSEIFLATKTGFNSGEYAHYYHPAHMRQQMEKSLVNLRTDCVDLMYLHHCNFGDQDDYFSDALETVRRFQEEGKTRFVGLSDWDLSKIMKYIDAVSPDVVQPYRNVMNDTYESSGLKSWIDKNNAGVCFFSPIKHGLLTGKYTGPAKFGTGDMRGGIEEFTNADVIRRMQENKALLEKRFADHPHPVMRGIVDALLTDAKSGCVLLGQRNVDQVNTAASLGKIMSDTDANWVKRLYKS